MAVFYVVRHAKAGSRSHWDQDDRLRPLSKKGIKQAEVLVSVLQAFPISAIFSSPYLRCVQTVEPLAQARELAVQETNALAEGSGLKGALGLMAGATSCGSLSRTWSNAASLPPRKAVSRKARPGSSMSRRALWSAPAFSRQLDGVTRPDRRPAGLG